MDMPETLLLKDGGICLPDTSIKDFLSGQDVLGPQGIPRRKRTWLSLPIWERPLKAMEASSGAAPKEPGFCPGPTNYGLLNLPGPPSPYL